MNSKAIPKAWALVDKSMENSIETSMIKNRFVGGLTRLINYFVDVLINKPFENYRGLKTRK